jgi:hypothetical protein
MRSRNWPAFVTGIVMLALAAPRYASAQVSDPLQYRLFPDSNLEYGCFGPCACPVVISGPLDGDFTFYRPGLDPHSGHFELLNIAWSYTIGGSAAGAQRTAHVTGHGTYDLAGEVALTQRMTLDLTTDDVLHQHFDSGWVPARPIFPAIDVDVRLTVNACMDSVFHVLAAAFGVVSAEPALSGRLIQTLMPNPSSSPIEFVLALPNPTHARVDVLDVRGRVVARLVDGDFVAGEQRLRWDGRDAHGADVGAGVFWIRAQAGTQLDRRRIVRLR